MSKKINSNDISKEQGDTLKTIFGWIVDLFVDKDEKSNKR